MKAWRRITRRTVARTSIFTAVAEKWRSPVHGRSQTFYFLESAEWVNVIAIEAGSRSRNRAAGRLSAKSRGGWSSDNRSRVVLIKQHRYGTRRLELEIPGGAIERRDRSPLAAAKRELLEETGYAARRWFSLGFVSPNPAFQRNRCYTFLATGARKVALQKLDPAEEISVTTVPLARIPELIVAGRIPHALVIAAFYKFIYARNLGAIRRGLKGRPC